MRSGLALLGAITVAAGCAGVTAPIERRDVLRSILPSSVQLRTERDDGGRRAGSGVVIAVDEEGRRSWILTTRHFLEPVRVQRVYVSIPGRPVRLAGKVAALGTDVDLAVIEVDGLVLPPVRMKESARLGDEVLVVAFPWGRRMTVVSGIVSQIASDGDVAVDGPARMVDASVSYGASGGGVFEAATGALIGVVESYRTARMTVPTTPEKVLDIPVAGETTLVSSAAIVRFLSASGLELPRPAVRDTGARAPVSTLSTPR